MTTDLLYRPRSIWTSRSVTGIAGLFAVNELFAIDNQVILAISSKTATDNHIMPLASYDLDSKQFRFWWDPDKDDTTVKFAKLIPGTDRYDIQSKEIKPKHL
ncbi:hypothetical protein [Brevibacillus laterosporus]|uniref:hypothetical protein n=1 Tax=Brevibacillus laterosporus TaxID=1465 RepID=UPI001F586279|nr:hypothetical protein [Brevibacillus laterosporus]